jgi:hypothetical protein
MLPLKFKSGDIHRGTISPNSGHQQGMDAAFPPLQFQSSQASCILTEKPLKIRFLH